MLFSFGLLTSGEDYGKGRRNENSTSIVGHMISVCDKFFNRTNCKDRRQYSDRVTRGTVTRTMESIGPRAISALPQSIRNAR
jgi:hypothetical protein